MIARIPGQRQERGLEPLVLLLATAAACAMCSNAEATNCHLGSRHWAVGGLTYSRRLPHVLLGMSSATRLRLRGGGGSKNKLEMVTVEHKSG